MSGVFPNMPNMYYNFNNPMQNQINYQNQFYNMYLQYCNMNGLNPQDQNNYNKYCQMWMMMSNNPNMYNPGNTNYNPQIPTNGPINQINFPPNTGGTQSTKNTNPDDNFYIQDENKPKEIIPREEKTLYLKPSELKGSNIPPQMAQMANQNLNPFQAFAGMGNDIINVTLNATTGFKVVIPAPKSMTFEDLFINFANKAGVPVSTIGEQIVFLYNAEKLDAKSKQPISSLFKSFNANVTVLDQGGIIGA